jgi:hypothetical protein
MSGVYSIAALIVTLAIVGIALTHTETAQVINSITSGFANALTAAKP